MSHKNRMCREHIPTVTLEQFTWCTRIHFDYIYKHVCDHQKKNLFAYLIVFPFQQGTKLVILEENAAIIATVKHSVLRSRKKSEF